MTDRARIKIAAIVTALFLAVVSSLGVALHGHAPAPAAATTPAPALVKAQPTAPTTGEHDGYEEGQVDA